jgi:hypothetical protein
LLFMAALGVWGLALFAQGSGPSGSFAGALVIGEILIAVQGAFGVALYFFGDQPHPPSVHILYGLAAILSLPFIWSYMRNRDPRQALLFFSLGALFIAGLAIRGITTG